MQTRPGPSTSPSSRRLDESTGHEGQAHHAHAEPDQDDQGTINESDRVGALFHVCGYQPMIGGGLVGPFGNPSSGPIPVENDPSRIFRVDTDTNGVRRPLQQFNPIVRYGVLG